MVEALQTTLDGTPGAVGEKLQRQCYSQEKKLEVIAFYQSHNLYQTAQKFSTTATTLNATNNALQIVDSFLARHLYWTSCLTVIYITDRKAPAPYLENAPIIGAHCFISA